MTSSLAERKKVVYVTSRFPYPPHSGEKVRSYELLQILRKQFDVHLICQNEIEIPAADFDFIRGQVASFKLFVRGKWRNRFNALKSFFNGRPLQVNYFYDDRVAKEILSLESKVDGIVCSLARTAEYARGLRVKKCLDMIDSIGQGYINSFPKTTSLFWKMIYLFEGERLLEYEKKIVSEFDSTFLVNQTEMIPFKNLGNVYWAPNGVSNRVIEMRDLYLDGEYETDVCFFGKMDYRPNIEACIWFARNVLPRLSQEMRFVIIGVGPTREILNLRKEFGDRVVIKGFLENPYPIIKSCLCLVAPMQTGSGIQNKVLEAMAIGQIVITSSLAAKAIVGARSGNELFVEDDPFYFVNKIHELMNLKRKQISLSPIGNEAKDFIKNQFNWNHLGEKIGNFSKIL